MASRKAAPRHFEEVFSNLQTIQSYMASFKNALLDKHELKRAVFGVMHIIQQEPDITSKQIALKLGVSNSAITQLIEKMEKDCLVIKRPSEIDKRVTHLNLSEKGEQIFQSLKIEGSSFMQEVLQTLTEEEIKVYLGLQQKIISNLQKKISAN